MSVRRFLPAAAYHVATGFGSGRVPHAPGTAGSVAAAFAWIVAKSWIVGPGPLAGAALAAAVTAGCWLAVGIYLRDRPGAVDPQEVVADEWAGVFVSLAFLGPGDVVTACAAVALFRLLDIKKPWVIGGAEALPGAAGVMADDVLAGCVVAAATLVFGSAWR